MSKIDKHKTQLLFCSNFFNINSIDHITDYTI